MELHAEIKIDHYYVSRVAGGWIYTPRHQENVPGVFVPFNNEFQN
jgi:hypothetical protein